MPELALMEREFDSMYVPAEKVPAFLADGWKEINRKPAESAPAVAPVAAETPMAEEAASAPADKSKGRGK
jgi:hypothetical protein